MVIVPMLGTQAASAAGADPQGTVYVADYGPNASTSSLPGSNGNVAPERVIQGADTGINGPGDVKVDADGDVWVSNFAEGDGVGNSITEYAPGASGDALPICTISGSNTGLYENDDMSLEPDGTLVVGNILDSSGDGGNGGRVRTGILRQRRRPRKRSGVQHRLQLRRRSGHRRCRHHLRRQHLGQQRPGVRLPGPTAMSLRSTRSPGRTPVSGTPDDIIVGFSGQLYVTNGYGGTINSVTVFAPGATGTPPRFRISSDRTPTSATLTTWPSTPAATST